MTSTAALATPTHDFSRRRLLFVFVALMLGVYLSALDQNIVPDLFAVVIGPSTLVVDGDVTFQDELTVPDVEGGLQRAAAKLPANWPDMRYVYLTSVAERRPRVAGALETH